MPYNVGHCSFSSFSPSQEEINAFVDDAFYERLDKVKVFVEKYPSYIDAKDKSGTTAFEKVSDWPCFDMASYLIENDAIVDMEGDCIKRLFVKAGFSGRQDIIDTLLDLGLDINVVCKYGGTAISQALVGGQIKLFEYLEARGAVLDQGQNSLEDTFVQAAYFSQIESLQYLLDKGVSIDAKDKEGRTALSRALQDMNETTVDFLISKGASVDKTDQELKEAFVYAGYKGCIPLIKKFLEWGMDIDGKDKGGQTVLLKAVGSGEIKTVDYLTSLGAAFDREDPYLKEAFVTAGYLGRVKALEYLFELGIDPSVTDKRGRTALERASGENEKEAVACIERLIQKKQNGERQIRIKPQPKTTTEFIDTKENGMEVKLKEIFASAASQEEKEIFTIIQSDNVGRLRHAFDEAFFDKRKINVKAQHLKMALLKENLPMLRFLMTWGASMKEEDLSEILSGQEDKREKYEKLLRGAGLNLSAQSTCKEQNNESQVSSTLKSKSVVSKKHLN